MRVFCVRVLSPGGLTEARRGVYRADEPSTISNPLWGEAEKEYRKCVTRDGGGRRRLTLRFPPSQVPEDGPDHRRLVEAEVLIAPLSRVTRGRARVVRCAHRV